MTSFKDVSSNLCLSSVLSEHMDKQKVSMFDELIVPWPSCHLGYSYILYMCVCVCVLHIVQSLACKCYKCGCWLCSGLWRTSWVRPSVLWGKSSVPLAAGWNGTSRELRTQTVVSPSSSSSYSLSNIKHSMFINTGRQGRKTTLGGRLYELREKIYDLLEALWALRENPCAHLESPWAPIEDLWSHLEAPWAQREDLRLI